MSKEDFKILFDKYFEEIRRYIYYRCGDFSLAEDIAQQAFLKVWEKQLKFLPGKEKGLLYKIASDEFIDQLRKKKVRENFEITLDTENSTHTPEEELAYKELLNKFNFSLSKMSEKQRIVFLMSRKEELKYTEIAVRLNISVKAVEKRMKGALQILHKDLP